MDMPITGICIEGPSLFWDSSAPQVMPQLQLVDAGPRGWAFKAQMFMIWCRLKSGRVKMLMPRLSVIVRPYHKTIITLSLF